MIAASEKLMWYVSRSSGMIAWAMVTASILWGLALSSRLVRKRGVPAWLLDLHRFLGTLSLVFTLVHLIGLVGDNFVHFGWSELFVPMASRWQPGNVAWGIAAFYALVAIQLTSWVMRRLPRKLWHTVHLTSLVLFVAGTIHGWRAGTDHRNRLVQWLALTGCILVVVLVAYRISMIRARARVKRAERSASASASSSASAAAARLDIVAADTGVVADGTGDAQDSAPRFRSMQGAGATGSE